MIGEDALEATQVVFCEDSVELLGDVVEDVVCVVGVCDYVGGCREEVVVGAT